MFTDDILQFHLDMLAKFLPRSSTLPEVIATGSIIKHIITIKVWISLSLNIGGNIWDNVTAQLNKIQYIKSFLDTLYL